MASNQSASSLPTTSSTHLTTRDQILVTILAGVHDPLSPLSTLRGIPHLVKLIYQLATNEIWWKKCIRFPDEETDRRVLQLKQGKSWVFDRERPNEKKCNDNDKFLFFTELDFRSIDEQWANFWPHYEDSDGSDEDDANEKDPEKERFR